MHPARRNKIDLDKLTDEERKLFRLYGKLPTGKTGKALLSNKERKYFDSGDYALSKAGKTSGPVGVNHPSPETIPHANANAAVTHNTSPVKESSLVHETEIDEKANDTDAQSADADTQTTSTSTSNQTTPVPLTQVPTPVSTLNSSTTSTSTHNS